MMASSVQHTNDNYESRREARRRIIRGGVSIRPSPGTKRSPSST